MTPILLFYPPLAPDEKYNYVKHPFTHLVGGKLQKAGER